MKQIILLALASALTVHAQSTYYVAKNGSDLTGDGSASNPWATPRAAMALVPDDGSTIIVRDGVYTRLVITREFTKRVLLRAEHPYGAKIHYPNTSSLMIWRSANIEIAGFDIARSTHLTTAPLAAQIAASRDIVLRNNIIHESFNNDLLKINEESRNILITGNVFRNQQGTAGQHIDVNGCTNVTIRDNIFFNDANEAGIPMDLIQDTHGFIVVKNSGSVPQSRRTRITSNIFLNYQGNTGSNFVLIGEDGKPFHEAQEIEVDNNLMLGNGMYSMMRAPFSVKGARDVVFRNNTVTGHMPARSFGVRFLREGANPPMLNLRLLNNIWSDPTGTMGDFSDGPAADTVGLVLDNNLYWNAGSPIPFDDGVANPMNDLRRVVANPMLPTPVNIVLPNWRGSRFSSGATTIRAEFERLVRLYGTPGAGGAAIGRSDPSETPQTDILGAPRGAAPDLGSTETRGVRSALRLTLLRERVLGGETAPLNFVFLSGTTGGTVMLASSNPGVASVPASITIPEGDDAAPFTITTSTVAEPMAVRITATSGALTYNLTVTVVPQGIVTFNALQATPPSGGESMHRVMMEGLADVPVSLTLTSSRPDIVSFPNGGVVQAGMSYADVRVHCTAVPEATPVILTARYGITEASAEVIFQPNASAPATLTSVSLQSSAVTGPATVNATVQLSKAAPAGGAAITITGSPASAAVLPTSLVIPAGATTASFNIQTQSVTTTTTVTINAAYAGVQRTAMLTVNAPVEQVTVASITAPSSMRGGETPSITVRLSAVAPDRGMSIALSSSRPDLLTIPATVAIPAGSLQANVPISVKAVTSVQTVSFSAVAGATRTASSSIVPPSLLSLQVPTTVVAGQSITLTLSLDSVAPTNGFTVQLTSNPAGLVPAALTIPGGMSQIVQTVNLPTGSNSATFTATAGGVSKAASISVGTVTLMSLYVPTQVKGGQTSGMNIYLTGPAPAGGLAVRLVTSRPDVVTLPGSVTVPAGESRMNISIPTSTVGSQQFVPIVATAGTITRTAILTVTP